MTKNTTTWILYAYLRCIFWLCIHVISLVHHCIMHPKSFENLFKKSRRICSIDITRIQSQNSVVLYLNCLTDWSFCKYLSSCTHLQVSPSFWLKFLAFFFNDICIDHRAVIGNTLCTVACKVVIKNVRTALDLLHRTVFNNSIVIFTSTLLPRGRLISVNTIVRLWQLAASN